MFLKRQLEKGDRETNAQFKCNRDAITRLSDEVTITLEMKNTDTNLLAHVHNLVKDTMNYIRAQEDDADKKRLTKYLQEKVGLLFVHLFKNTTVDEIYHPVTICASVFSTMQGKTIRPRDVIAHEPFFPLEKREEIYTYFLDQLSLTGKNAGTYSKLYETNKSILPRTLLQKRKKTHIKRMKEGIKLTFAQENSLQRATGELLQGRDGKIISLGLLSTQEFTDAIAIETKAYFSRKTLVIKEQMKETSTLSDLKKAIERYRALFKEQPTNGKDIEQGISAGKQLFYDSPDGLKRLEVKEAMTRILSMGKETLSSLTQEVNFFVESNYTKEEWQILCNNYKQFLEEKKKK